jgi:glycosyltransferase involved in cell wall biosynthesis
MSLSSTPKVSIIIPTFNRADLLPETIDSVLTQSFADYEIIVVDDGSTDTTRDDLEPLIREDQVR